jgi:EAL domain-containing protein (putative c-di-GMP-specific phosphodiesterase class I)
LGELVLREACNQIKEWERAGIRPPRVAVNISPRQFAEVNFADSIAQMLKDTRVRSEMLELEITEGVFVKDVEAARLIFSDLKSTGVRLALDDFGTGYSALAYLKRFPFDTIKIDRSFVSDIATDPFDEAIAASVVALGRALDLVVTAEGVETEKQLAVIRDLRCQEAQGYLFSRPLPAADLYALLRSGKGLFSSN